MATQRNLNPQDRPQDIQARSRPTTEGRTDEDLAQDIEDLLGVSGAANAANLRVLVNHGIVTLSEVATAPQERLAAENVVRNVSGVVEVINQIAVATA